jgi:methionyl-tRNA formyltransferase
MRTVFAGTPDFAVPALRALVEDGHAPVAVLTQPDRPSGRGRKLRASPVKRAAEAAGLPVLQPATLKDGEAVETLAGLQPDLMVVVAYGLILPQAVLDVPRHGCWNIHASLLPRWRGAAPIQRAIEAGDRHTGVCIMQMEAGLDTGPVLHRVTTPILDRDTGGTLHDRLSELGAGALGYCLARQVAGQAPKPAPQADEGVTYAHRLEKAEARLDFDLPAEALARRVRAFNPWPVTWCDLGGERLRVWAAEAADGHGGEPGEVVAATAEGLELATAAGRLRLLEVQRPGGRRIAIADYLNAVSGPLAGVRAV